MARDARIAWNTAAELMEQRWDRASYETWLRPTSLLRCEDNTFFIGVHDSHVFDMLAHRLHRDVKDALCEVTGREVEVEFRVEHAQPDAVDGEAEMPLFKLMARAGERGRSHVTGIGR